MRHITSLTLISIILFTTSCYNCGGVNETHHTYAYKLDFTSSSINQDTLNISIYNITMNKEIAFFLYPQIRIEEGDRKCHTKDLVIGSGEAIEQHNVKLYCDKDLLLKNLTITQGANLLEADSPIIIDYKGTSLYGMPSITLPKLVSDQFSKGTYTFYLEGTSNYGNTFKDTAVVIFN